MGQILYARCLFLLECKAIPIKTWDVVGGQGKSCSNFEQGKVLKVVKAQEENISAELT